MLAEHGEPGRSQRAPSKNAEYATLSDSRALSHGERPAASQAQRNMKQKLLALAAMLSTTAAGGDEASMISAFQAVAGKLSSIASLEHRAAIGNESTTGCSRATSKSSASGHF